MKEITLWECEVCGGIGEKKEVMECEKYHAALENLDIVDMTSVVDSHNYNTDPKYPTYILIEDKTYSGRLALYKFEQASSVEDFDDWKEKLRGIEHPGNF